MYMQSQVKVMADNPDTVHVFNIMTKPYSCIFILVARVDVHVVILPSGGKFEALVTM